MTASSNRSRGVTAAQFEEVKGQLGGIESAITALTAALARHTADLGNRITALSQELAEVKAVIGAGPGTRPVLDPVSYRVQADSGILGDAPVFTDDPAAEGGRYVALLHNNDGWTWTAPSALVPGNYRIVAHCRAMQYQGYPELTLQINGNIVTKRAVTNLTLSLDDLAVAIVSLIPGDVVNLLFLNELSSGSNATGDRNIYLDYVEIIPTTDPLSNDPDASAPPAPVGYTTTANRGAMWNAKKILKWMYGLPGKSERRVISGQSISHDGTWAARNYDRFVTQLAAKCGGKRVAYVASGYTKDHAGANAVLAAHWNAGGLVGVDFHPDNPWYADDAWVADRMAPKRLLTELLTTAPASPQKTKWFSQLDTIAAGLQDLQARDVIVLFRPLHEQNSHHFWYGFDNTRDNREEFKAFWRDMFSYLTVTKGLNNLLWVFSACESWYGPVMRFYPGDDYVDIVGLDIYRDDLKSHHHPQDYTDFLPCGKPFILAESGPQNKGGGWDGRTMATRARDTYPKLAAFLQWHSWDGANIALVDNQYAPELIADPLIITMDEVDWKATPI